MSYFNFDPTKAPDDAYNAGFEDGVRQERERIREALLRNDVIETMHSQIVYLTGALGLPQYQAKQVMAYALDHIGLGAVTTEESEK